MYKRKLQIMFTVIFMSIILTFLSCFFQNQNINQEKIITTTNEPITTTTQYTIIESSSSQEVKTEETFIQSTSFVTEEIDLDEQILDTEETNIETSESITEEKATEEETEIIVTETILTIIETPEDIVAFIEEETEIINNDNTSSWLYNFTDDEIDMITNVVMHEVGPLYSNSTIIISYPDGTSETYENSCIIHRLHAQVLINQFNSSIFPNTLSSCIKNYWATYLANPNYYNHNNETWQHCREDVLYVMQYGTTMPNNVFGATQDPYFADHYTMYSRYAKVSWSTRWTSGTFYYYQHN